MYSILQVCLIGMGTVFCGLIALICLVTLMGKLLAEKPANIPSVQPAATSAIALDDDDEIAVVLAAAVSETLHGSSASVRIVSIEKIGA